MHVGEQLLALGALSIATGVLLWWGPAVALVVGGFELLAAGWMIAAAAPPPAPSDSDQLPLQLEENA